MAFISIFRDIIFVEGEFKGAQTGNKIEYDAGMETTFNKHLKTLRDVKEYFANAAKSSNYNSIINFEYGQRSKILTIDGVTFWGSGILANIPNEEYLRLIAQNKNS